MLNKRIKNKKIIIEFLIIFLLSLLICNGFIRMHYTTDTYKIADGGFANYAKNYSLKDGRIIMFGLLSICNVLKLPIEIVNFLFTILGIFISCISVMIIKNMIDNIKEPKSKRTELYVLVLSYFLIFNFMYIEAIYFLEIVIISLSILLFILATKCFIEGRKHYLIYSMLLVIAGIISYQGTISFFMAFATYMLLIQNKKLDETLLVKKFLTILFITFIAIILDIIMVKFICSHIGMVQGRLNLNNIFGNIQYIINNFDIIIFNSCGLSRKYVFVGYLILIVILSYIYFIKQHNINNFINIIIIVLFTMVACFSIFSATLSSFNTGRMYIILGGLPSMLLLYIYANSTLNQEKTKFYFLFYLLTVLWIIINVVSYVSRINESREKNILEKEYCNKNELTLKKACVILIEDHMDEIYFNQIKSKNNLTINEIKGYGSAVSGFNVVTGKKLEDIKYIFLLKYFLH